MACQEYTDDRRVAEVASQLGDRDPVSEKLGAVVREDSVGKIASSGASIQTDGELIAISPEPRPQGCATLQTASRVPDPDPARKPPDSLR